MPCNCGAGHCAECMGGSYTPPPPPEFGSIKWKDDRAFEFIVGKGVLQTTGVYRLPTVYGIDLGYFVVRHYPTSGTDYFRVEDIINLEGKL